MGEWNKSIMLTALEGGVPVRRSRFFDYYHARRPVIVVADGGVDIVYQGYNPLEKRWDVYHVSRQGEEWSAPVGIGESTEDCIQPDLARDGSGTIHAVWAEKLGGVFRVVSRSSADGAGWSAKRVLADGGPGAWRPRITAVAAALVVVWEDYRLTSPAVFRTQSFDGGQSWSSGARISGVGASTAPALSSDGESPESLHVVWSARKSRSLGHWSHLPPAAAAGRRSP